MYNIVCLTIGAFYVISMVFIVPTVRAISIYNFPRIPKYVKRELPLHFGGNEHGFLGSTSKYLAPTTSILSALNDYGSGGSSSTGYGHLIGNSGFGYGYGSGGAGGASSSIGIGGGASISGYHPHSAGGGVALYSPAMNLFNPYNYGGSSSSSGSYLGLSSLGNHAGYNFGLQGLSTKTPSSSYILPSGGHEYTKPVFSLGSLSDSSSSLHSSDNGSGHVATFTEADYNQGSATSNSFTQHFTPALDYSASISSMDGSLYPKFQLGARSSSVEPSYASGHKSLGHYAYPRTVKKQVLNTHVGDYNLKKPNFSKLLFKPTSSTPLTSKYNLEQTLGSLGSHSNSALNSAIFSELSTEPTSEPHFQMLDSSNSGKYLKSSYFSPKGLEASFNSIASGSSIGNKYDLSQQ